MRESAPWMVTRTARAPYNIVIIIITIKYNIYVGLSVWFQWQKSCTEIPDILPMVTIESLWYDLRGWLGVENNYLSIYLSIIVLFPRMHPVSTEENAVCTWQWRRGAIKLCWICWLFSVSAWRWRWFLIEVRIHSIKIVRPNNGHYTHHG